MNTPDKIWTFVTWCENNTQREKLRILIPNNFQKLETQFLEDENGRYKIYIRYKNSNRPIRKSIIEAVMYFSAGVVDCLKSF